MKITLLADDHLRLDPVPGAMTIEAPSAGTAYSPFHMLASALATCTFSVIESWASHAKLPLDDLSIEVRWRFADDPHRVSDLDVSFTWPSLPANRVAELCTVHATLLHSPTISIEPATQPAPQPDSRPAGVA